MGVASYNRGSRVIADQADRQLAATRLVKIDRYALQGLEDEASRLRLENATLRRDLGRAMLRFQERAATLTYERRKFSEESERLTARARDGWQAMRLYRRRWQWVSRIVRQFVRPEDVADCGTEGRLQINE